MFESKLTACDMLMILDVKVGNYNIWALIKHQVSKAVHLNQ